jgi:regulator of protease activity HflC (stomatin/prohibitin superfamily)
MRPSEGKFIFFSASPVLNEEKPLLRGVARMSGFAVFVLALLVLIIVTVIATAKVVPQGNNFTVERLGRYVRTLKPGLGIIVPFIERTGHRINMMEQVLDIP